MTADSSFSISPSKPGNDGITTTTLNFYFLSWARLILSINALDMVFSTEMKNWFSM